MTLEIRSTAPHDFYMSLDVDEYFEAEYEPMDIFRTGYARPLTLSDRNVLAVIDWNEDPEAPVFRVDFPGTSLSADEEDQAREAVARMLGTELDLEGFYERVEGDDILGPLIEEHYGFRRLSLANFYQDAIRSIIHTRISHGPTRKRMVQDVREAYGEAFEFRGTTYYSYPRPDVLQTIDPVAFRDYGVSKRKGEYITGMAKDIVDGRLDLRQMESVDPDEFYRRAQEIRGIGPSTAQSLMLRRNRSDAVFPSHKSNGKEKGIRRWILMSYGLDPHDTSEEDWQALRDRWRGYEALVSQYFYYDWVLSEKSEQ